VTAIAVASKFDVELLHRTEKQLCSPSVETLSSLARTSELLRMRILEFSAESLAKMITL
jgi:hypothetical protein